MAGVRTDVQSARDHALAVLRTRNTALALALLPAAVAVVLLVGSSTGTLGGLSDAPLLRWGVVTVAGVVLLATAGVAAVVACARPAVSPTVPLDEAAAPELYRLVRDLADRLDVPAPSALALTPDCDSWLEDRTHRRARAAGPAPAHGARPADTPPGPPPEGGTRWRGAGTALRRLGRAPAGRPRLAGSAPGAVGTVGGAPLRSAALRVLSPPGERRPTAGARRHPAGGPAPGGAVPGAQAARAVWWGLWERLPGWLRERVARLAARRDAPVTAPVLVIGSPFLWWMRVAELRALLAPVVAGTGPSVHPDIAAARRYVRGLDAAVAAGAAPAGADRSGGLGRVVRRPLLRAAGWVARLLLRSCGDHVTRMERGVAAASSARAQTVDYGLRIVAQEQVGLAYAGWDRLLTRVALPAWRIGRWPCRLNAGVVSALTDLSRRDRLAEGFASRLGERPACDLLEEPGRVDEAVSLLAAQLFHGGPRRPGPDWAPVDWPDYPEEVVDRIWRTDTARLFAALDAVCRDRSPAGAPSASPAASRAQAAAGTLGRVLEQLALPGVAAALAARLGEELAREEGPRGPTAPGGDGLGGAAAGLSPSPPVAPLLPAPSQRSDHELLVDHVTAAVCCAAADTTAAVPGLDWLDGPVLVLRGERRAPGARVERRAEPAPAVRRLAEDGDPEPLRRWLAEAGVPPDKPVRLV